MDDTVWVLQSMTDKVPAGVEIELQFEKDKITGKGVCNRYFADYELNGKQINFQSVGATKMMCEQHNDWEAKYFQALQNAQEFTLQKEKLIIKTKDGDLIFKPANTTTSMGPASGGPNFSGVYYSGRPSEQYWQSLMIYPAGQGFQVVFSASPVNNEPACYFQAQGYVQDNRLVVPLAEKRDQVKMVITNTADTVSVFTEAFEDRLALLYYCSGGASLAGTYVKDSNLILSEDRLGTLELNVEVVVDKQTLATHFPNQPVVQGISQQDGPDYTYYSLQKEGKEVIRITVSKFLGGSNQQINSAMIYTEEIPDQYGIRKGMTYTQAKQIRPSLQLITNSHFHTYAFDEVSNIKYEICCNTDQLDKTTWSEQEVRDWKIKSIIWEAS